MKRFGIYFTPSADSGLANAASRWLGRDIWSAETGTSPEIAGLPAPRIQELLQSPRHYGFHATIKPPFRCQSTVRDDYLSERLAVFAAGQQSFRLPELELTTMSNFFCLRPTSDCNELYQLAADAVQHFDDLRLPPTKVELLKRRAAGLTANQEAMLQAWGYPYVMGEYHFHLTLTGKTVGTEEQNILHPVLTEYFPLHLLQDIVFDNLALFVEEDGQPMYCLACHPLQPLS